MTDPRRRLRVVTEAAYASSGPAVVEARAPQTETSQAGGTAPALEVREEPEQRPLGSEDWTGSEDHTRGNRWGTPVLLAVRLGVVVLVLAVAATVTIVLTRPSAPAHQPEFAWPEPPQDWVGAEPGSGPPGPGPDASGPGGADGDAGTTPDGAPGQDQGGAGSPNGQADGQGDTQGAGAAHLVVHVAGAVHTPGIVELPDQARVHEAITAAGGATEDADLAALNLAASVQDSQQVYVPVIGEEPRANSPDVTAPGGGAPEGTVPDPATSDGAGSAVVDLNSATATDLQTLPGIGPAMADRILAHRHEHGPFSSVDGLLAVSGIGPATMERLRDLVTV